MTDPNEHKIALLEQRVEILYSIVERLNMRLVSIEMGWVLPPKAPDTNLKPKSDNFGYPSSRE
jgi:hypothetical protein